MKKQKIILLSSAILASETLLPINVLAKEESDIWIYDNVFTSEEFKAFIYNPTDRYGNLFEDANYAVYYAPYHQEFNVPERNSEGFPIKYFGADMSNKNISYLSFIETKYLERIGFGYNRNSSSDNVAFTKPVFKGSHILKILWNKDGFYENDISIEKEVFQGNDLTYLEIPDKLKKIGDRAFTNNKLINIKGLENVETFGENVFANNNIVSEDEKGNKFEIPRNWEEIPKGIFYDNLLTYVEIPKNIKKIGGSAFASNPLRDIYFESQDTEAAGSYSSSNVTAGKGFVNIYSHGESGKVYNWATTNKMNYYNLDPYLGKIEEAENKRDELSINNAFDFIKKLPSSPIKEKYTERLNQLNSLNQIDNLIIKAEESLKKEDYEKAKNKIELIENETVKSELTLRIEKVKKQIDEKRIKEIEAELNKNNNQLTLDRLTKLKEEIKEITGEDNSDIDIILESKRRKAELNSYKTALSYIEHAKEFPTLKNVLNAQEIINSFPEGYKLTEDIDVINENEFLLDSNGKKIIDEEKSFKKEEIKIVDEITGIETNKEIFLLDSEGNKILKDGLITPIYIKDPTFGKEIKIKKEVGSKDKLQEDLDYFSGEIYAKSAIEIAKKYYTQEKLDDALLITMTIQKDSIRKELLKEIEKIQEEVDNFDENKKEIEELLKEFRLAKEKLVKEEAILKINKLSNNEMKKEYNKLLKQINYEHKLKDIFKTAKKDGFSEEKIEESIVILSLIGENYEYYSIIKDEFDKLALEYDNYEQEYFKIYKASTEVDKEDKDEFNSEFIRKIKEQVEKIKTNNPYKKQAESILKSITEEMMNMQNDLENYDFVRDEIINATLNKNNVTDLKLAGLKYNINKIENNKNKKELISLYDNLILDIIETQYFNKKKLTEEQIEKEKNIASYIFDENTKKLIYKNIDEDLIKKIQEDINNNDFDDFNNLEEIIKKISDENQKENIINFVDDKIVDQIKNTYVDKIDNSNDKEISKEDFIGLLDLFNAIKELDKKEAVENVINNITASYLSTSYPEIHEGNVSSNTTYQELADLYNYFDGIHMDTKNDYFNDVKNDINQAIENKFKKEISENLNINNSSNSSSSNKEENYTENNNSNSNISNNEFNDKSNNNTQKFLELNNDFLKNSIETINNIKDESVKNNLESYLNSYLKNQLNNFDLSDRNSLSNLTKLGDMIDNIDNSVGGSSSSAQSMFTDFLQDNSNKIWDVAVQENNQESMMRFLSEYLSQDELQTLIHNDHDNVIGVQNNDENKYINQIKEMGEDMNALKEALENLQKIIDGLTRGNNSLEDSSVNTINGNGNNNKNNYIINQNGYADKILGSYGIPIEDKENELNLLDLQKEITELQKENNELVNENIVALKAAVAKNDDKIKEQLENYKSGDKKINNVLIGLGASMWLLILLGLMYNANLNLRNKKNIEEIKEYIIKDDEDEKETQEKKLDKIIEENKEIKLILKEILDKNKKES